MLIRTIQTDTLFSSVYDLRSSMGYVKETLAAKMYQRHSRSSGTEGNCKCDFCRCAFAE